MKNWKTTVLGLLALALGVLKVVFPDLFTEEVLGSINAVAGHVIDAIVVILGLVAVFSAKDEIKIDNA